MGSTECKLIGFRKFRGLHSDIHDDVFDWLNLVVYCPVTI
jgi:hypothetical protein